MTRFFRGRLVAGIAAALLGWLASACAPADGQSASPPDLGGVYRVIADAASLATGEANSGSPGEVSLLPEAATLAQAVDLADDHLKWCQPIGPFRMMALERNTIELISLPTTVVMLFEDISHGLMRTIFLSRTQPEEPAELSWLGYSTGRWEGDTLVVDTSGFNDQTWLNDRGAPHSEALHLVERVRPILEGRYLEYQVTADDPQVLTAPYTYTRYYEKLDREIMQDVCEYK